MNYLLEYQQWIPMVLTLIVIILSVFILFKIHKKFLDVENLISQVLNRPVDTGDLTNADHDQVEVQPVDDGVFPFFNNLVNNENQTSENPAFEPIKEEQSNIATDTTDENSDVEEIEEVEN